MICTNAISTDGTFQGCILIKDARPRESLCNNYRKTNREDMDNEIFTSARLTPDSIRVGDSDEFVIKLELGKGYTGDASRIMFDFSCTLGTSMPTREVNEASGYVEAYVSNPHVGYQIRCWDFEKKYFVDREHPSSREAMRMVVLDLDAGLKAGDTIELHWGETTGGFGPGAKVSTVVPRPDYRPRVEVRYFNAPDKGLPDHGRDYIGYTRPVPDYSLILNYTLLPREPRRMRLLRKSDSAILIPYDVFWNVPPVNDISVLADCSETPVKNKFGAFDFKDKNVTVSPKGIAYSESVNMDNAFEGMNLYWGDIHSHSAYSIDCAQRSGMDMKPDDLMAFARYRAGLDFYALTDHHIPHMPPIRHLGKEKWEDIVGAVERHHCDGDFVVLPAFEFTDHCGDICLYFREAPSYEQITKESFKNVSDYYADFGMGMMAIPHLHAPGSREFGKWREGIQEISPVIEVYSDHGSFEREYIVENGRAWCKPFRADNTVEYFLQHGYKFGLVGDGDDHKGHVGVNGLTAIFAKELTRESVFDAYFARRTYATTNARIKLIFTGNGKLMGSTLPFTEKKALHVSIDAENALKKIDLFRNSELYERYIPEGKRFTMDINVESDTPDYWYVRATQLDNHIAYSSPIWFE